MFEVKHASIKRRTLEIGIYNFDVYSRHDCIGSLKVQLGDVDFSEKVELWKSLRPCDEQDVNVVLGDLLVSLSYLPSAERLTVVVIKGRNLKIVETKNSTGNIKRCSKKNAL